MNSPVLSELSPFVDKQIEALPKAELHVHLEGTMVASTFLSLAQRNRHPDFMHKTSEEIMQMYEYHKGPEGFGQFLDLFGFCSEVIQKPEDIVFVIEKFGEYALAQNIRYAEITFTPATIANQAQGISYDDQLPALKEGIRKVSESSRRVGRSVDLRFILDHSRGYARKDCIATAEMCLQGFQDGSVVGIGLGGGEDAEHPVSQWAPLVREVIQGKLPFAPHVAEAVGPESIFDARDSYPDGFLRFGHGIQAARSDEVLAWLASEKVVLEICPSSNLATGVVPDMATFVYLMQRIQLAGVAYTINTDDPAQLPNALEPGRPNTLTNEFKLMVRLGLETPASLARMALRSVGASFLPEDRKRSLGIEISRNLHEQGYRV